MSYRVLLWQADERYATFPFPGFPLTKQYDSGLLRVRRYPTDADTEVPAVTEGAYVEGWFSGPATGTSLTINGYGSADPLSNVLAYGTLAPSNFVARFHVGIYLPYIRFLAVINVAGIIRLQAWLVDE